QKDKTKVELSDKIKRLQKRIAELETGDTERKQIDEALKKSEDLYRVLFDGAADLVAVVDLYGNFIELNNKFEEESGWSRKEMLGKNVITSGIMTLESSAKIAYYMAQIIAGKDIPIFEVTGVTKQGEKVPYELRAVLIKAYGKLTAIQAILRNITERKKAGKDREKLLHDMNERIKELGCFYALSEVIAKPGISLEVILQGAVELFPPAYQYPEIACARIVFENSEFKTENFRITKWKQSADIEVNGKKAGYVEVYYLQDKPQDYEGPFVKEERQLIDSVAERLGRISERKRAEGTLKESEEKIHLLLDSTAEAIYGLDMNGNCTFCNQSCLHLLGYRHPGELLGKNMHWQIHAKHPDGTPFPVEECRIFQAFKKGEGTHVDDEVLWRSDGTSFPAEYWSYPQHHDGVVVGAVVTFLDITERKKGEEALKDSQELLVQSEKMSAIGRFSAGIAHEVKNPLSIMLGGLEFLETKLPHGDEDSDKMVKVVKDAVLRANFTLESLIHYARPSDLIREMVEVSEIVNLTLGMVTRKAGLANITIDADFAQGMRVSVDKNQVHQALLNIIMNAMEAMPTGGNIAIKTFKAIMPEVSGEKSSCVIEVIDTGTGISQDNLIRVTEPFFTTKGSVVGTGLGLFITNKIMESHNGKLLIESTEGKGTVVKVVLPLAS
ncbi:MAG: PAS domain S-box protein, partial [Candidatus Omnitrophica bacterium]|nr:PAS domain S-box protein [Candidatus Omnitrophota bacterium]